MRIMLSRECRFSFTTFLSSCWVALGRPFHLLAVLPVCLSTGEFFWPQEAIPPDFDPLWLGLLSGAWGTPIKGNASRAKSIFGNAGRMWALPCNQTHLKTALCHICPVVGQMINTREYKKLKILVLHLMVDWLILMTSQPVWGYFMPRG